MQLGAVNAHRKFSNTTASDAGNVDPEASVGPLPRGGNITADAFPYFSAQRLQLVGQCREIQRHAGAW